MSENMETTSAFPFEATHSQVSSESSSTCTKPHEDTSSTTTESTSHIQSLPTMVEDTTELSRLEQLPPELRLSILTILDLDQLKNLIKSSPTFYQQYRDDRKFILGSVLHKILGPLAVDAYAVHQTSPAKFDRFHPKDAIPQFLKDYQRLRSSLDFSLLETDLTGNDLTDLAMFHLVVVRPFMKMYKDWAFTNIANEFKKSNPAAENPPLSRPEEIRIMRALYRFQLWCNLFGRSESGFDEVRILDMFFSHYEPWEVEEINSVYFFAKDGSFTDPYWDFDISNDRIFATYGFHFEFESTRGRHKELGGKECVKMRYIFHKLEILPTPSTQLNALYTSLFSTINPCEYIHHSLLGRVLSKHTQRDRRIHYPSPRDQRERDEEPFPFKGDDPAQPPLAWTQTWRDEYSNLFGAFIPDGIPEWGLMMWDEPRFENFKGYEVVWYSCKDEWGRDDPRERFRDQEDDDWDWHWH